MRLERINVIDIPLANQVLYFDHHSSISDRVILPHFAVFAFQFPQSSFFALTIPYFGFCFWTFLSFAISHCSPVVAFFTSFLLVPLIPARLQTSVKSSFLRLAKTWRVGSRISNHTFSIAEISVDENKGWRNATSFVFFTSTQKGRSIPLRLGTMGQRRPTRNFELSYWRNCPKSILGD